MDEIRLLPVIVFINMNPNFSVFFFTVLREAGFTTLRRLPFEAKSPAFSISPNKLLGMSIPVSRPEINE